MSLGELVKTVRALSPQSTLGGAVTGVAIDRKGYQSAVFTVITGAIGGTPDATTCAVQITECATSGGTYTNISGATATLTIANTVAEVNLEIGGNLGFLQLSETTTFTGGSTPTLLLGATCTLGKFSGLYPV